MKQKKEPHISKVSILKKKPQVKITTVPMVTATNTKIASLVNSEYNDPEEGSNTPPLSPGSKTTSSITIESPKMLINKETKPSIAPEDLKGIKITKMVLEKKPSERVRTNNDEDVVLIDSSPDDNNKQQIMDYDDENDKNFVGAEVSLCAAAGDSDQGELSVMEPFPQVDISEIAASPLDAQEYVLFSSDGVDYTVDSDDSIKHLNFINKDNSVVISYSRQTSESNEENMQSPAEGSEDEGSCIQIDDDVEKPANMSNQTSKKVVKIGNVIHEVMDDSDIVVIGSVISPEEHIATEEDFEELIDGGKPEDAMEEETAPKKNPAEKQTITLSTESLPTTITRTETTKKTVAVISLGSKPPQHVTGVQQFKLLNTGKTSSGITRLPLLNSAAIAPHSNTKIEVSQASVASVSIANQTISVPVLKTLNVPMGSMVTSVQGINSPGTHIKKVPITISTPLSLPLSKPITSVISVISTNIPRMATLSPVITLATTSAANSPRMPIPILTQQHIKQKIIKTMEKPAKLSISTPKITSMSVSKDTTLPANIFQDESASPDSSLSQDEGSENDPVKIEIPHTVELERPIQKAAPIIINNPLKPVPTTTHGIMFASQTEVRKTKQEEDIEKEITKNTEVLGISKPEISKSPDRVSEKIPDNIMEGDEEEKMVRQEEGPSTKLFNQNMSRSNSIDMMERSLSNDSVDSLNVKSIKATANPTKEIVLDSNMRVSSDVSQESIQISIPSPTPSQEQYLDNITLQAHSDSEVDSRGNSTQKQDDSLEEMLNKLYSGEQKLFPMKLGEQQSDSSQDNTCTSMDREHDSMADLDDIIRQDLNSNATDHSQESSKSTIPVHVIMRSRESSPVTVATSRITTIMPQLSPLSKPTELTTNIANGSQQVRTIMSSLNTSKVESTVNTSISSIKKTHLHLELPTSTQVNFENLLPSTKVEVVTSKISHRGLMEKAVMNSRINLVETSQMNLIQNSRISNVTTPVSSAIIRGQQSPHGSPTGSPRHSPLLLSKSPIQSPLVMSQSNSDEFPTSSVQTPVISQQLIQMPALSKIQSNVPQPMSTVIQASLQTASSSLPLHKQLISTNILSSTLLQAGRHGPNNIQLPLQSISSSQPPALVMSSRPATIISAHQLPPNVQSTATHSILSASLSQSMANKSHMNPNIMSTSKLLHSQLTSPLKRSKSTDEPKSDVVVGHIQPTKRHSLESVIVKSEPMECDDNGSNLESSGCKFSSMPQKTDESQNVLLKQLLQNSGGNSPNVAPSRSTVPLLLASQRTAPSLGIVPSLEAQLARPSIPPPPHLPLAPVEPPKTSPRPVVVSREPNFVSRESTFVSRESPFVSRESPFVSRESTFVSRESTFVSRESPFVSRESTFVSRESTFVSRESAFVTAQSRPPQSSPAPLIMNTTPIMTQTQSSTQSLMDVRKPLSKLIIREEPPIMPTSSTPTSTTPSSAFSMSSEISPLLIKKEVIVPQQSPVNQPFIPQEVKKELLDECSQQSTMSGISAASDQKLDITLKEELSDTTIMDTTTDNNGTTQETALEAKKRKRREYQQKRRQMQNNQKIEATSTSTKKRPRKGSKVEEDYDTFIDNLMAQLRQLQPMQVQEPMLGKNYGVCPVFGLGDLSKIVTAKEYNIRFGDLIGEFGTARIPNVADFYNAKPFGEEEPIPEKPPVSTQRGFYDQEFSPIRLDTDSDEKKLDFLCKERDVDTPDTIVSSSSPESWLWDDPNPFPGLRLINEESDSEEEVDRSTSPIIPIITPIPIRVKPLPLQICEKETDKENICNNATTTPSKEVVSIKSKLTPDHDPENAENVTVTLTLTSGAAEDILGVLRKLAGILHIPPPTAYQIVERTATPPSHRLGLYRSKGKDGKEGTTIDIQSILNGAAKFCRHCDVVILDSVLRAKASEFPSLKSSNDDLLSDTDSELYFCSAQCYKRFAWRPTNILIDNKSSAKHLEEESNLTPVVDSKKEADTSVERMETDEIDNTKRDIKDDKMELLFMDSLDNEDLIKEENESPDYKSDIKLEEKNLKSGLKDSSSCGPPLKQFRGLQYKLWSPGCIVPPTRYKRPTDREITELVFRTGIAVMPVKLPDDMRRCFLCQTQGDGVADGPSRLLNYDVDKWVHLNCALWSDGVYETVNGALMNFENALQAGMATLCIFCERPGATVRCFKTRCSNVYHLSCAVKDNCVFHKNKTAHCTSHVPKGEKENELTTLSVQRRVYVQRDESRQVAAVMHLADLTYLLRVGGLIFLSVGQLLPHQLATHHTPHYIYPIGYKIVSIFSH